MLEIKDPSINHIVKTLASTDLLNEESIVLAGGFATWLYHLYTMHPEAKSAIASSINLYSTYQALYVKEQIAKVGDIDYWQLSLKDKKSPVDKFLDRASNGNVYLFDIKNKKIKDILSREFKDLFGLRMYSVSRFSIGLLSAQKKTSEDSQYMLLSERIKHQVIRIRRYQDISDIFSSFDINVCKVAWKDDILYVSDEAEKSFKDRTLSIDIDINTSIYQRVETCRRIMKYYSRYGFQPDKATVNLINEVFYEAIYSLKNAESMLNKTLLPKKKFIPHPMFDHPEFRSLSPSVISVMENLEINSWPQTPQAAPACSHYDNLGLENDIKNIINCYRTFVSENIQILTSFSNYNVMLATILAANLNNHPEIPTRCYKYIVKYIENNGKGYKVEPINFDNNS